MDAKVIKRLGWAIAATALVASGAAYAQQSGSQKTPANFPYEIKNGKRVPKVARVTNPDGSWTEQSRQGNCTVTRNGKAGEVRETRKCD